MGQGSPRIRARRLAWLRLITRARVRGPEGVSVGAGSRPQSASTSQSPAAPPSPLRAFVLIGVVDVVRRLDSTIGLLSAWRRELGAIGSGPECISSAAAIYRGRAGDAGTKGDEGGVDGCATRCGPGRVTFVVLIMRVENARQLLSARKKPQGAKRPQRCGKCLVPAAFDRVNARGQRATGEPSHQLVCHNSTQLSLRAVTHRKTEVRETPHGRPHGFHDYGGSRHKPTSVAKPRAL